MNIGWLRNRTEEEMRRRGDKERKRWEKKR
jgi:hypothetical protein